VSTILDSQQAMHTTAFPQALTSENMCLARPISTPLKVPDSSTGPGIDHRDSELTAIIARVTDNLRHFFQTNHEVLCFPGTDTAGMEATVVNLFSPGDHIAAISIGYLGDRFASVARIFGLVVEKIEFPWGQAANPEVVAKHIRNKPDLRGVLLTHVEASTGVVNDLPALAHTIRNNVPNALIAVDASYSLGCIDVPIDILGLDVAFAGSHEDWMCPSCLMAIAMSPRAIAVGETVRLPRFYWYFADAFTNSVRLQVPYALPITLWYQLDTVLTRMRAEGREAIFARHAATASYIRQRLHALGLRVFADQAHASDTVTVVEVPKNVDFKALREQGHVVFADGQGKLTGKFFRIDHLGPVHREDIAGAIDALEYQLARGRKGSVSSKQALAL
jgi:aspartate aminotransferase-like enzyme